MRNRIFAATAATVTLAAGPCMAQGCGNETIKGTYLFTVHGKALNPATPSAVVAWLDGVGTITFDGNGGSTQQDFVVHNAVAPNGFTQGETGTYTVNADCTGTAETATENGSVALMLVISPLKGTIHAVVQNKSTGLSQTYSDFERISNPTNDQNGQ